MSDNARVKNFADYWKNFKAANSKNILVGQLEKAIVSTPSAILDLHQRLKATSPVMPPGVNLDSLISTLSSLSAAERAEFANSLSEKPPVVDELFERATENLERENERNANPKKTKKSEDKSRPPKKLEKKLPPNVRFYKAIKDHIIEQHSGGRTSDEYLQLKEMSEKEIFDKWYKKQTALGKTPTEEEIQKYKQDEDYKKKIQEGTDEAYFKKYKGEIRGLIHEEQSRIYDKDKNDYKNDPVYKELKKIKAEGDVGYYNQALESYTNNFHQKAISYSFAVDDDVITDSSNMLTRAEESPRVAPPVTPSVEEMEELPSIPSSSYDSPSGGSNSGGYSGITPIAQPEQQYNDDNSQSSSPGRSSQSSSGNNNLRSRYDKAKKFLRGNKGAGKAEEKAVAKIGQKLALQLGSKLAPLMASPWFWIVLLIILLLLLILFLLLGVFDDQSGNLVSITKSRDKEFVDNPPADAGYATALSTPQDITYTLNVSYSDQTQSITVTDPIPENAIFVSADNNAEPTKDGNGNVTSVRWTITPSGSSAPSSATSASASISGSTSISTTSQGPTSSFVFDAAKFSGYGFPAPQDPNPAKLSGNDLARWKTMMPYAVIASQKTGVDVGILGMWAWIESTFYSYMNNCGDKASLSNQNSYCDYQRILYQIGAFGNHPEFTLSYLKEAFENMHPGETVQAVGQKVLDNSKDATLCSKKDCPITNPSSFPDISIDDLVSKTRAGDVDARMLTYSLYKDDAIGAYLLAKHFKDIGVNSKLASSMRGWGSYYDPQKIINHIKGIYDAGIDGSGGGGTGGSMTLKLVVRPKPDTKDAYIINQAFANATGGTNIAGSAGSMGPSVSNPKNTAEWINIFKNASTISKVPWEFLASVAIQESGLGSDFGTCSYYPIAPGGHVLALGNGLRGKSNDATNFAGICLKINKPLNTGVSCNPAGSCCGGAMGYTQIMPDELVNLGPKVEQMLGHYPDPWNAMDAAVLTGIILKNKVGIEASASMPEVFNTMFDAAWRYYGKTSSGIFYPNEVMARYKEIKSTQTLPK